MIKGKWLAWIAAIGLLIAFGPAIGAMIIFATPILPKTWSQTINLCDQLGMFLVALAAVLWMYSLWQKNINRFSAAFLSLGLLTYMVADLGFGIYARMHIGNHGFTDSFRETLFYVAMQPVGTFILAAPFIFLAWLGAFLAEKRSFSYGLALFVLGAIMVGDMYFFGHLDSQANMLANKWTAATLSIGLLPFMSLAVLFPLLLVAIVLTGNEAPKP